MLRIQRKTTPMSKRGQILAAYAMLSGVKRMGLKEISTNTGITVAACSNIIREAKRRASENGNPDLCATENLTPKPNAVKGCSAVLSEEQKQALIDLALSDAEHCRMAYEDLAREDSQLPYHVYQTPYETDDQKYAAEFTLDWECIGAQQEMDYYLSMGVQQPREATASRARDSRGFTSSHGSRLSIDPDHHVTEAIGDMYGEYIDEDGRRQSYILPSDTYSNSTRSAQNRHSSVFSATGAGGSGRDWSGGSGGGSRGNELLPGSPTLVHRSPSPSRSPSETANQFFPLNDTDYESDPAAVAQEISNLQALRRMSMDVTSTADPDLPSFNTFVPSTPPDDGGDPGSVFWVPARLHPELAPKEFSAYLEAKKNEIRRPERDGSLSPDGADFTSPGLRRKKSMLSRQIDHSEGAKGYRDGIEALERRRSGKEGPPHLQLEDLMSDPSTLMRKLSVERRGNAEGDLPILAAAAPGAGLRRSTRTTYRRGSLRKGEKMPFSKRQARASETDTEDYSPVSSPINGRPGPFGLQRVSTEPIPPIPSKFSGSKGSEEQPPKPTRPPNKRAPATAPPSGSLDDLSGGPTAARSDATVAENKHKSAPPKQKRRASSPKGTSRTRVSEPTPPVPRIIETPPPLEEPQKLAHPERHSSLETTQQTPRPSKPQRPPLVKTPGGSTAEIVNDPVVPPAIPSSSVKPNELMPIPFTSPDAKDAKDRKRPDSAGSTGEASTRKSSWGWLLGDSEHKAKDKHEREREERREKEREEKNKVRKEKRPKTAEKPVDKLTEKHDNTRLDLLQKSIDLGNTGKVITTDPIGVKTEERHEKERKSRGEEKKEKESGGLLSFFGGSRKKSGGDTSSKQKSSSSRNPSPDPSREQPHQNFYYTRFPIHIERAIYRLSHLKLANPRRPLHQQVLLSNFMYSYLAKVQQTQPHLVQQATVSQPPNREERHREKQARENQHQYQNQQGQQQAEPQGNQYYQYEDASSKGGNDYVDDSQMYEYTDGSGNESDSRPQSRASRRDRQEGNNGHYDYPEPKRSEHNGGGGGGHSSKHHHSSSNNRGAGGVHTNNHDKASSDDMW